jgi:hypothetical protein
MSGVYITKASMNLISKSLRGSYLKLVFLLIKMDMVQVKHRIIVQR